jgi:aminoglycoside/choline kinase family phosphotransferase
MSINRQKKLNNWLIQQPELTGQPALKLAPDIQFETVAGDASFRRYCRVKANIGDTKMTFIGVDADPRYEDNQAFCHISSLLRRQGLNVPHVLQAELEQGFMLLTDLGNKLYLDELNPENANHLYSSAIDDIIRMQVIPETELNQLPLYDEKALNDEMLLFNEWFIKAHLKLELSAQESQLIQNTFDRLAQNALEQPQVFVHRDYHSRNLMITETHVPGIIDFQDAVVGAISYDLVSLLKDCYIEWPHQMVVNWCQYFYNRQSVLQTTSVSFNDFFKQFELMGMQRHIKVLGIFCRLFYRDGKASYLNDLALTFKYLIETSLRYEEFKDFHQLLEQKIQPNMHNNC